MKPSRAVVAAGAALGTAYATACVALYLRGFGPRPHIDRVWTPSDLNVEHESIDVLTEDGLRLQGWYLPGTRPAAIVVSGGYRDPAGEVLAISTALVRAGFHVFVYGWRGTPGSDRAMHTLGVHERLDLRAAIDAVAGRVGDVPIGLLGYSMGAAVSITVAADDPRVAAVCADSAFSDPRDVLGDGVRRVLRIPGVLLTVPVVAMANRRIRARLSDFSPRDAVARLSPRPLLIIHGDADTGVRPYHAERLFAAAREPKQFWLVSGAGHCGAYFADRAEYVRRVTTFFDGALGPREAA